MDRLIEPQRRRARGAHPLASRLLLTWLGNCVGVLLAAALVPAISYGGRLGTLLFAGAILALVNLTLRPLVILLTLPAVILTLGAALMLVNTLMLALTSSLVGDLRVGGFLSTLAGALVISLVNLALRPWRKRERGRHRRDGPRVRVVLWR